MKQNQMPDNAPAAMVQKEFLTVEDIKSVLSVSRSTVYNIINRGEIRATFIGKKLIRIHRNDFREYLDKHASSLSTSQ